VSEHSQNIFFFKQDVNVLGKLCN